MRFIEGNFRFSASDLMRFKGCRHATLLDLRLIEKGDISPRDDNAEALLLQQQGDEHVRWCRFSGQDAKLIPT